MFKLPEEFRDQIMKYLANLSAPAAIGADLMKIVGLLQGLEKLDEPAPVETES